MSTRISITSARLDDPSAMAAFLAPIPNSEVLAKVLQRGKPVTSRAYDDEAWTARFVGCDGITVQCLVVTDVTIDQAEMIAVMCVDHPLWSEATFREAVELALGPTFDPAQ